MAGGFQVRIVAEKAGRDWVVMLPGAGATSAVWFLQVRSFRREFNVALVDLPGHTGDERARDQPVATYTFESLVNDLNTTVAGAGIVPCHVVALSLGTILARAWAVRYPQHVRSLVLAGTIGDFNPFARGLMKAGCYVRFAMPYMALYRVYAWTIMPGRHHRLTRKLFYRDARRLGRAEFNRWFDLAGEVLRLLQLLRSLPSPTPVLHVLGSQDYMFLRRTQELAEQQHSEIVVVRGVGHVCSVEAPDVFNAVAVEFLSRHGSLATS